MAVIASFSACQWPFMPSERLVQVGQFFVQPGEAFLGGFVGLLGQSDALDLELADPAARRRRSRSASSRSRSASGWPPRRPGRSPCRARNGRLYSGRTRRPPPPGPSPLSGRRGGPRNAPSGPAISRSCPRPTARPHKRAGNAAPERHLFRCACGTRRGSWPRSAAARPRASIGFIMLPASMAPSAAPAPTIVCSSSIKVMTSPPASEISFSTAFRRSSNSPRYLAPATMAPRSSARTALAAQAFGHIALDYPAREALHDGRLAHAGLTDQHRVVLRTPREDLDDSAGSPRPGR